MEESVEKYVFSTDFFFLLFRKHTTSSPDLPKINFSQTARQRRDKLARDGIEELQTARNYSTIAGT
jgi:hypothetical protein